MRVCVCVNVDVYPSFEYSVANKFLRTLQSAI